MAGVLKDLEVLVVDDDGIVRKIVGRLLEVMGVKNITYAEDGAEALGFIGESGISTSGPRPFDLIICDWSMPNVEGIDVLRNVRAKNSDVAFIMLTAQREAEAVLSAKKEGVTAYLAKPIDPEKFKKIVSAVIAR